MEKIETETLNYLRLAFYNKNQDDMAEKISLSKNTIRYALKWGMATPDTLKKLLDKAEEMEKENTEA